MAGAYSILHGDVLEQLATLPDGCVQCVVTSPPYWRQRDYGVAGQIGMEATPEEYVAKLVAVFREVRRVLRPDGTLFLNLGDTYSAGGNGGGGSFCQERKAWKLASKKKGIKAKELLGIPWRVAFALQADGWYLRQEIIWHKPDPMPEGIRDRCCRSHEHVFLLTQSPRYYWDHVGVMEDGSGADQSRRTPRTVWKISKEPTKEKHFAAYPSALVYKCLQAGVSPQGCCAACGAPRQRVTERRRVATRPGKATKIRFPQGWASDGAAHDTVAWSRDRNDVVGNRDAYRHVTEMVTVGWEPSCECSESRSVGCIVLDPFSGTAQTGRVAVALGHCYLGIELSEEYIAIAHRNIARGWPPVRAKSRRRPAAANTCVGGGSNAKSL